ncbi:MAG: rhamnan synthesis F family protein [Methylocella sp.]
MDLEAETAGLEKRLQGKRRGAGSVARSMSWTLGLSSGRMMPWLRRLLRCPRRNPLFDREWYIRKYPDVERGELDPYEHYLQHGAAEGRNPNPLFDTNWYLRQYSDVKESGINPLLHFFLHGAAEGRDPNPLFDTTWYLERNPDVAASGTNALFHYVRYGSKEGRDPHPLFDVSWYLAENPDVAANGIDPLADYLLHAILGGRDPNPFFDTDWYLAQNPDVACSDRNPLAHYFTIGASNGSNPSSRFDAAWYLDRNPDVARAGMNPLHHFLQHGRREGRAPSRNPDFGFPTAVDSAEIHCLKAPSLSDEMALFVTHSPHGRLKPHVRHYLDSLKRQRIAIVLIVAADDAPFSAADAELLDQMDGIFVRRNEGYDFAAWAHILRLHPELFKAKILYLLNDSLFGPTNDDAFQNLLRVIRTSPADFLGLTDNYEYSWHIQSYFLALKPRALLSDALRKFIDGIVSYADKNDVIKEYEIRFASTLMAADLICEPIFPSTTEAVNHTIFHWKRLIAAGFPFIKVTTIRDNFPGVDISDWREVLAAERYDVSLAERTLAEAKTPSQRDGSSTEAFLDELTSARGQEPGLLSRSMPAQPTAPWPLCRRMLSRLARRLRGPKSNPLFDRDWYLRKYPDVEMSELDPYEHYLLHGAAEGRDPNPVFDTNWYIEQYPDVKESGVNPLAHFYLHGAAEGRNPNPLFSTDWYCAKAGLPKDDSRNPLVHFLSAAEERLDPSPLFDGAWYTAQHPEIAYSELGPFLYYLKIGAQLAHVTTPLFDPLWYAGSNPDVPLGDAFNHFVRYGLQEGRNPNPYFDSEWYRATYDGCGPVPFVHYLTQGRIKNSSPGPLFDASGYQQRYSNFFEKDQDALSNYLTFGKDRGFNRFDLFGILPMRVAVIAHLYYDDLWPQLAQALLNIPIPCDIYITIPSDRVERLGSKVLSVFPNAKIINSICDGRDIGPFLQALTVIDKIMSYDAICKIHTKKGITQPDVWRYILLQSVLGNRGLIGDIIRTFQTHPKVCLIGPKNLYISGPKFIGPNGQNVSKVARALYPDYNGIGNWGFFAGSMFWFRPTLLLRLAQYVDANISFEIDSSHNDGQIAHALERTIGMIASLEGLDVGLVDLSLREGDDVPIRIGPAVNLTDQVEPTDYLTQQAKLMRGLYPVNL